MPKRELTGDDEELRRAADHKGSMSERLARVHYLSKQMSAIKGAASLQRSSVNRVDH
jgi:hypothetical protein